MLTVSIYHFILGFKTISIITEKYHINFLVTILKTQKRQNTNCQMFSKREVQASVARLGRFLSN